jgi:acyl-CoA synthetase (AMP-forming)/AMP-acid ligase II
MPKTIIEYLHHHVAIKPDEVAFNFLAGNGKFFSELTFKEFWFEALSVANFLKSKTQAGDKVLLTYPLSLDYVIAFYGCLIAGVIAVPAPLPHTNSIQFLNVLGKSKPTVWLTNLREVSAIKTFWLDQDTVQPLNFFTTDNSVSFLGDLGNLIDIPPRSPAFLRYSSDPAAAEMTYTHGDIIEIVRGLPLASVEKAEDVFVSWIPFFQGSNLSAMAS